MRTDDARPNRPALHWPVQVDAVRPAEAPKVPHAQSPEQEEVERPVVEPNVPAGQPTHVAAVVAAVAALYVPAGHALAAKPLSGQKWPTGHASRVKVNLTPAALTLLSR